MGTSPGGKGADIERAELSTGVLQPAERSGLLDAEPPSALRHRMLERTQSNSLVPDPTRSLLQSRIDHAEFVEWQEGGGEAIEQAENNGDIFGSTVNPPRKYDHATICGIDKRPFWPTVLIVSLMWSMCMTWLQGMVIAEIFGSASRCNTFFFFVYSITIGAALNTSLSNPGLMSEDQYRRLQDGQTEMPPRGFKHWLYRRPVLRFHQYCRWVTNCVGLRNHRSYMVMLGGFVTVAVADTIVDLLLVPVHLFRGTWTAEFMCLLHLLYSVYFAIYAIPLLRQHCAFVARNELTQEWKADIYYVVRNEAGEKVPVVDLDTEDYNRLFDSFEYDPTKNKYDQGPMRNCFAFWFTSRAEVDVIGDF